MTKRSMPAGRVDIALTTLRRMEARGWRCHTDDELTTWSHTEAWANSQSR